MITGTNMSFIHDNPWLINQLLKTALDSENKISKTAQPVPPDQSQIANSLRAMLDNLRDQITPLKEGPTQVGHASGGAELSSHNMDSMGDLVEWMSKNGTRIGNQVIVMDGKGERPSEDYGYFKIEPGTEIVVPLAKPDRNVRAFWINPTALKNYLVSLQSDPKLKGNVIFQVQLLKLIQDANNQLDLDLSEQYKEPEKTIPDDTVLDNVPNPINRQGGQTVPLTYGDLKALDKFWNWAIGKGMSMEAEDKVVVQAGTQEFDRCAFIQAIAARAKSAYAYRKPNSQQYWAQVQVIAKEAECDIGGSGAQQGGQSGTQPGQMNPQALMELSTLRPFNSDVINFREIQLFTHRYAQLANRPNITQMATQIDASINDAKRNMNVQNDTIMIAMLTDSNDLEPLKALTRMPAPFMDKLYTIIYNAGSMYQDFYNTARYQAESRGGRIPDDVVNSIAQQVAEGGPWSTNMADINQMREDIQKEIRNRGR